MSKLTKTKGVEIPPILKSSSKYVPRDKSHDMPGIYGEEYENDPGNIVPLFQDVFEILNIQKLYDPKREESILAWRFVDKNKNDLMHLWSTPEEEAEFREDFRADKNSWIQGIKNAFHNLQSIMGMLNEVDKNTLLNQTKLSDLDKKKLLRYNFVGLKTENGTPLLDKDGYYIVEWEKIDPALRRQFKRTLTPFLPTTDEQQPRPFLPTTDEPQPTRARFRSDSEGGRRKTKRRSTTKKSKRNSTKKRKISIKKRKSIKRK
jgi:hypothetical protein